MTPPRREPGSGSITSRSKTRHLLSVTIGYDDEGRQVRKYETFRGTRTDAKAHLDELCKRYDQSPAAARGMTFQQFAETKYVPHMERKRRQRTVEGYGSKLKTHLYPRLGSKPLDGITPYDVEELMADLEDAGVGEHSRYHVYRILNQVMNKAVAWEFIDRHRCKLAEPPRRPERDVSLPTAAQARKLLAGFVGDPVEPAVVLALGAGLRRSEACGMAWSDVILKPVVLSLPDGTEATVPGTVSVVCGRHRVKGGVIVEDPKTRKSKRTIAIPSWTVEALKRHRKFKGPVLQRANGRPMDPDVVSRAYKERRDEKKLPAVALKDLRHTFATLALERGVPLWQVAESLGHSTQRTTELFYVRTHGSGSVSVSQSLEDLG